MRGPARLSLILTPTLRFCIQPAGEKSLDLAKQGKWNGLNGEVLQFDNSPLCLYDMEHYGIDKCRLRRFSGSPDMFG